MEPGEEKYTPRSSLAELMKLARAFRPYSLLSLTAALLAVAVIVVI
jgi:hypothetical protein